MLLPLQLLMQFNMVTLAIILAACGMLVLPLGRLFVSYKKHKGDPYFSDASNVRKFTTIRRVISIILIIIALIILNLQ